MSSFGRDELLSLLAPHETPCVSLFLPRHRHPPETERDRVRVRNLLRSIRSHLDEAGFGGVAELLRPLEALGADLESWSRPGDGLAVFRSPDSLARHALPGAVPERVVVAGTFHVRPLLRFLEVNQHYFVLALSQNRARLHEGTPSSLTPLELKELPSSLDEAAGAGREPFLNLHTAGPGSGGAVFHGHGGTAEPNDEDVRRYFRAIDAAVRARLRNERAPLFLAGVSRHIPLYREISRYPHVARGAVEGNVDDLGCEQLRDRVAPLVEEVFRDREREALDELARARGRGLASLDLAEIGRHAVEGRVRQLLLGREQTAEGTLDLETGRVGPGPEDNPLHDDLLDDLAETVIVRGGDVLSLPAESLPEAAPAAAVLRW